LTYLNPENVARYAKIEITKHQILNISDTLCVRNEYRYDIIPMDYMSTIQYLK